MTNATDERDSRQEVVAAWAAECFGQDEAFDLKQRGLRLFEEAVEAAQAVNCDPAQLHRLVDYVFSREPGTLVSELGGVGLTTLALAEAAGLSADGCERRELERVLSKPREHFAQRNAAKNAAGFKA